MKVYRPVSDEVRKDLTVESQSRQKRGQIEDEVEVKVKAKIEIEKAWKG